MPKSILSCLTMVEVAALMEGLRLWLKNVCFDRKVGVVQQRVLKKTMAQAGICKPMSVHSFATHLLQSSIDIHTVQE